MILKTSIQAMAFVTVTALLYINMQTQIVELAYKGKDKQKNVRQLMEKNGALTHQVLTLKSANSLGNRLLEKDDSLQFMGRDHMTTVTGPILVPQKIKQPQAPLWNVLSFLSPQEARAWDH